MVLKRNTFSSHGDSTYPDVLFMRWRRVDGKEKHTNVNAHISIQRKPWHKTRASFQVGESSGMERYGVSFLFHHDTHTHWLQKAWSGWGSSNSWPVSVSWKWATLKHAWPHCPQPPVYPGRTSGPVKGHSLPQGSPGLSCK